MSTTDDGLDDPGRPAALASREAQLEPFDWYRRMRTESPIRYDETRDCWGVFQYETVNDILLDEERFSSVRNPESTDEYPSMLGADPPEHTKLREPVEEFFTASAVQSLAPDIREMTEALLDDALADGSRFDLVSSLSYPLPIMTIAALIGVPPEDREQFKEWSDTVVAGPQLTGGDPAALEDRRREAGQALVDYFAEVIDRREQEPQDDLVSQVITADGRGLTESELLGLFRLLLVAGNVTTTNLITNAIWCLAEYDRFDAVDDEQSIARVLEETLRYRSPVQRTSRVTTTEVTVDGHTIPEGETILVWLGAANRDPERFEAPDQFKPGRSPNPHLGFGRGIHICLGAPLARLESRIALEVLFERVDELRLVETEFEPLPSTFLYGVQSLPVEPVPR